MGDIPFVHSFSVFLTSGPMINRYAIAYPQLNVKLAGFLPGLTTLLGPHQAIDDLALMRVLPNLTIIEPSSETNSLGVALQQRLKVPYI
ncbi:MAG: hypothetical protein CM15mP85_17270 [Rhodobacterales bacterium]|nr:MAG: hypothetical protein CM15mP85_17270 [Rhodobacterales bacterium]